jgi:Na+/H+-dicarboxylate symporter
MNMKCCTEKLGISPKVSSFSIPLGSTVNMDGTCIILVIGGLFLARAYGIEVPDTMHLTLLITILLLSIGAPVSRAPAWCVWVSYSKRWAFPWKRSDL